MAGKSGIGISTRATAIVIGCVGLAYLYGGGTLIMLGGSPYFLLTGIAVVESAILMWRGNAWGAWIYVAMLVWTLCWAIAEVGIDFWGLLPRLFGPCLFGLCFLTPGYWRETTAGWRPLHAAGGLTAGFALSITGLIAWAWFAGDPYEIVAGGALPERSSGYPIVAVKDWLHYGNDAQGTRFSPLTQIAPGNVGKLQVAWRYRTGEYAPGNTDTVRRLEVTPLKADGTLFFCTPESKVIALDAASGRQKWQSAMPMDLAKVMSSAPCRGVAYYAVPAEFRNKASRNTAGAPLCATRIIAPSFDARLRALDAMTGEVCTGFGDHGTVDLKAGLGPVVSDYYYVSSAPQIVRGRVVVGGRIMDARKAGEPSSVIRAFDATTGAFSWAFDIGQPDRHGMPKPGEQFTAGTPNSWAPISADEALGAVYLPTGNAVPDFWAGKRRPFDKRFSSAVIALDAESGTLRWTYQTTHQDLWDMDVPAQPSLIDLVVDGRTVPALVQLTKRGQTFVLDRRTGQSIFPVVERTVPRGGVDPANLSPTQPFSPVMPDFSGVDPRKRHGIDEADMWGITPFDLMWCRIQFKRLRYDGPLTPPGEDIVLQFPGSLGGANWQSGAFDPERKVMVVNWNRFPFTMQLIRRMREAPLPGQANSADSPTPDEDVPYSANVQPFLSPLGSPCLAPPYQMVSAVDLSGKRLLWSKRAGTAQDTGPMIAGMRVRSRLPISMGPPGIGGTIITRSGLVFIAASGEESLRAMDLETGNLLWKARLPAGGNATPMTYEQNGRQYIVIAAGGHNQLGTTPGDYIIAYALPAEK